MTSPTAPLDAIAGLTERLLGLNRCIRCDCQSCRSGFENHEHICTDGPGCVKPLEKRLRKAVRMAEEAATHFDAQAARVKELDDHVQRLQRALMFWMPSVTEATDTETDGRVADDAYLLMGDRGPISDDCWGDKIHERALRAERERDEAYERAAVFDPMHRVTRIGVHAHDAKNTYLVTLQFEGQQPTIAQFDAMRAAAIRHLASGPDKEREQCQCIRCLDADWGPADQARGGIRIRPSRQRMVVCQACGNKRCPHATDHRLACTYSNEPGQNGSVYA